MGFRQTIEMFPADYEEYYLADHFHVKRMVAETIMFLIPDLKRDFVSRLYDGRQEIFIGKQWNHFNFVISPEYRAFRLNPEIPPDLVDDPWGIPFTLKYHAPLSWAVFGQHIKPWTGPPEEKWDYPERFLRPEAVKETFNALSKFIWEDEVEKIIGNIDYYRQFNTCKYHVRALLDTDTRDRFKNIFSQLMRFFYDAAVREAFVVFAVK